MGVFTGAEIRIFISELQIEILDANKPPLLGEQRTAALAACESPSLYGWKRHGGVEYQKPPLLGEVARRSRDGEVAILREDGALAFSMMPIHKSNGMQPLPKPATPQALRASSLSRGAKYGRYL